MTADQKRAYEFTMKERGQVPGPYKIFLQNPKLIEVMVLRNGRTGQHDILDWSLPSNLGPAQYV
jgi:hypothetical protein